MRTLILSLALLLGLCPAAAAMEGSGDEDGIQYEDQVVERPFALEDARTIGEGHIAGSVAGGYPESRLMFQFTPERYFDMGVRLDIGYNPDFDLSYFLEVQFLEAPGGWFNLGARVRTGFRWEMAETDRFYFTPKLALVMGFGGSMVFFPIEVEWGFDVALPKNQDHRSGLSSMAGVEVLVYEKLTLFAKAGYDVSLYNDAYQGVRALGGVNFGF